MTTVDCSGCMEPVKINRDQGTATATRPSNGKRGSLRTEAQRVTVDLINDDGHLVTWDCPLCEYADSLDLDY